MLGLSLLSTLLLPVYGFICLRFKWRFPSVYRLRDVLGLRGPKGTYQRWLHCASVGEVLAAKPLLDAWLGEGYKVLVTTYTPTGAQQLQRLFHGRVEHRYLPIDHPLFISLWSRKLHFDILVLFEMEFWPVLLAYFSNSPKVVINARMSERSFRRYQKWPRLSRSVFASFTRVLACTSVDAKRIAALGSPSVEVAGNIKFDVNVADAIEKPKFSLSGLKAWAAVSTHEGEEERILQVHQQLRRSLPELVLILVPRHPERFRKVEALARQDFDHVMTRSQNTANQWLQAQVVIGDSMGELLHYCSMAQVVFMGGSLIERGGHNPLEPAALGKAVVSGTHTFNFELVYRELSALDGVAVVESTKELEEKLLALLTNTAKANKQGQIAQEYVRTHQGALGRVLQSIESMVKQ